jgi:isoleucyl-tRNA synthetase
MRKNAGYEVTDRINITYTANERLDTAVQKLKTYVMNETLAADCTKSSKISGNYTAEWDINGESCGIGIQRVVK